MVCLTACGLDLWPRWLERTATVALVVQTNGTPMARGEDILAVNALKGFKVLRFQRF